MDEEFDKACFQFKGQLFKVLKPLERYGQADYVTSVVPEILNLAIQLHWRLSGADIPIESQRITYTP